MSDNIENTFYDKDENTALVVSELRKNINDVNTGNLNVDDINLYEIKNHNLNKSNVKTFEETKYANNKKFAIAAVLSAGIILGVNYLNNTGISNNLYSKIKDFFYKTEVSKVIEPNFERTYISNDSEEQILEQRMLREYYKKQVAPKTSEPVRITTTPERKPETPYTPPQTRNIPKEGPIVVVQEVPVTPTIEEKIERITETFNIPEEQIPQRVITIDNLIRSAEYNNGNGVTLIRFNENIKEEFDIREAMIYADGSLVYSHPNVTDFIAFRGGSKPTINLDIYLNLENIAKDREDSIENYITQVSGPISVRKLDSYVTARFSEQTGLENQIEVAIISPLVSRVNVTEEVTLRGVNYSVPIFDSKRTAEFDDSVGSGNERILGKLVRITNPNGTYFIRSYDDSGNILDNITLRK